MEKSEYHKTLKKTFKIIIIILLIWLSFGAGVYLSGQGRVLEDVADKGAYYLGEVTGKYEQVDAGKISQDVDFSLFWQVWDFLQENYVDKEDLNEKELFYGAIRGMVNAVDDPYTVFMNPKSAKEFSDDLKGTFEGIGAEIGIKNDTLTIIAPLPDMPAEKAGLRPGDKVLAIDKQSTAGISIEEAVDKIRGPKDTEVVLSIKREDEENIRDISITRGQIVVKSVSTEFRDDGIFIINISNFNDDTDNLFNQAVREVLDSDPKGIVLDLRSNPGGYLETAIEVASEWVDSRVVVVEKYTDDKKIEHLSRGRARLQSYPTVVLVNQGSASASEIVAGALQDHNEAAIVGMQTFGKGSVQTLNKFPDGSSVKVTVAKWLTPSGRSINDEGIAPDFTVDYSRENYENGEDPQLDKAIELLNMDVDPAYIATSTASVSTSSGEGATSSDEAY